MSGMKSSDSRRFSDPPNLERKKSIVHIILRLPPIRFCPLLGRTGRKTHRLTIITILRPLIGGGAEWFDYYYYYYYYYYYCNFYPCTYFIGNEKNTLCNTEKYKNQVGMNLTPPPPSQNSHAVRWQCIAESERRVAEIKRWFLCRRPTDQQACDRVLLRHNGIKREEYSSIHTQIHTVKRYKKIKTVKRNRTNKTRVTSGLLYCAGECVPYSLVYCLPADVSRRQTVQTSNCNKSLWY